MFYVLDDRKAAVVYSLRIPFEHFRTINSIVHGSKCTCYEWERWSVARRIRARDTVGRTRENNAWTGKMSFLTDVEINFFYKYVLCRRGPVSTACKKQIRAAHVCAV